MPRLGTARLSGQSSRLEMTRLRLLESAGGGPPARCWDLVRGSTLLTTAFAVGTARRIRWAFEHGTAARESALRGDVAGVTVACPPQMRPLSGSKCTFSFASGLHLDYLWVGDSNVLQETLMQRCPEVHLLLDSLVMPVESTDPELPVPVWGTIPGGIAVVGTDTLDWARMAPMKQAMLSGRSTAGDSGVEVCSIIVDSRAFFSYSFFLSLASTPNESAFHSSFVQMLITYAWSNHVKHRFYTSLATKALALVALMRMTNYIPDDDYITWSKVWSMLPQQWAWEVFISMLLLSMSVAKGIVGLCMMVLRFQGAYRNKFRQLVRPNELLNKYLTSVRLDVHVIAVAIMISSAVLLVSFFIEFGEQRAVFAFVVVFQWLYVLFCLRATQLFGRMIIPILNTIGQIWGWVIVFSFLVAALFHGQVVISNANYNDTIFANFRLLLYDIEIDEDVRENHEPTDFGSLWVRDLVTLGLMRGVRHNNVDLWTYNILFFCIVILLGIIVINLLVAVLGEKYDRAVETVHRDFCREQCALIAETLAKSVMLPPAKPGCRRSCLARIGVRLGVAFVRPQFVIAARPCAAIEDSENLAETEPMGRLTSLKRHTEREVRRACERLEGQVDARLEVLRRTELTALDEKLERLLQEQEAQRQMLHQLLSRQPCRWEDPAANTMRVSTVREDSSQDIVMVERKLCKL